VVTDEEIKDIQDEIPLCMLFAYDIVLIVENLENVNYTLDEWKLAFEKRD